MRLIELRSPLLDPDAVALSFVVHENLSQEPSYQLDLLSHDPDLDFDALLGSTLSADIDLGEGDIRTFNTHVFGGYDTGQMSGQYTYTLELRSWLSFLAENRNSRIFQNMSVPQIVEQVFQGHQRNGYRFELEGTYEPREYCVQFQETDLNFVKRLLEDEGIYFWVEHEPDRHVVVISDTQRFEDLPLPNDTLEYLPDGEESRAIQGREGVQRLQRTRRIKSNNVALRDFDYHAPSKQLDSDAQVEQQSLGGIPLEYYDYAAGYRDPEQGERLARLRLEAIQAESHTLVGEANARALATGRAFTLVGHPALSRNRRYYVTNSELTFIQDGPDSTSQGRNVAVKFRALADDQPFRPLLDAKRPRSAGHPERDGGGSGDVGSAYRQARADSRAFPLGPLQDDRGGCVVLDSRDAGMGGQGLGRDRDAAGRAGSHRRVCRRRSRSAARDGHRLQRRKPDAL